MKKFFKSIYFPITLFIILEGIFFVIGFFTHWHALCELCPPPPGYCPPCPHGHYGFNFLALGIIPSFIISFLVYYFIKKHDQR